MHSIDIKHAFGAEPGGESRRIIPVLDRAGVFGCGHHRGELGDEDHVLVRAGEDPEEAAAQHQRVAAEEDHTGGLEHPRKVLQGCQLADLQQYWHQYLMGLIIIDQFRLPLLAPGALPRGAATRREARGGGGNQRPIHMMCLTVTSMCY